MKVFLDANVILDAILPGREFRTASTSILNLEQDEDCRLCVSSLTVANVWYIARKYKDKAEMNALVKKILDKWKIIPLEDMDVYLAIQSTCPDFEDALQISCAEEVCDVIVTADKKHFASSTVLPVFTPEEFVEQLRLHNAE